MEKLKKVSVNPSKMEILNKVITQQITNEIRQDDGGYLEGVVATGCEFGSSPGYGVSLLFIYNGSVFISNYDTDENVCDSGMYITREDIGMHLLEEEKRRAKMRGDYSLEQEIKYGTILYDRNGKIRKLQEEWVKEPVNDINYWMGMCEFEPPVQYKKSAKI